MDRLARDGWTVEPTSVDYAALGSLRESAFGQSGPGQRCLLDDSSVRKTALTLRAHFIRTGVIPETAVAIQAIAFDKNPSVNWKVTWHQDLMFPFAEAITSSGFELPSVKMGVNYARPPRGVLEDLLAVRLHLDDCEASNGPLRVLSGSHQGGILKSREIAAAVGQQAESVCLARTGEALLMRPLLLHASSPATSPTHRRVLHFVYHTGATIAQKWHRAVSD